LENLGILIPAAGQGTRLGTKIPKPFVKIGEKSILQHTVSRLISFEPVTEVVIACGKSYRAKVKDFFEGENRAKQVDVKVARGGTSRQASVSNALHMIDNAEFVAVHDAVRPFVSTTDLHRCLEKTMETGAAILGVPVQDTIKVVDDHRFISETPDRSRLWCAQTPQMFRIDLLRRALRLAEEEGLSGTDDASLVEMLGEEVYMVEGSPSNFKITYPADLQRARQIMEKNTD
jgi:2-C-methyl-D-erythritol 4-phosphate cytidylyltransferase